MRRWILVGLIVASCTAAVECRDLYAQEKIEIKAKLKGVEAPKKPKPKPKMEPAKKPTMSFGEAMRALQSDDPDVQFQGALVLYEMGPKAATAVPTVIEILEKQGPEARLELLHVLVEIGPAGKQAVPILMKCAKDEFFHARYLSCRALGRMGAAAKPAVPLLIESLEDSVTSVRRNAAESLGRLGPDVAPEAVKPLIKTTGEYFYSVRVAAILALGHYGALAKEAVPALKKIVLKKERAPDRCQAAWALWKITGDTDLALPALRKELFAMDCPWDAAKVLGQIGPAAGPAVDDLIKALDLEPSTQVHAAEALGKIGKAAKPALPALRGLLTNKEEGIRVVARQAIRRIEAASAK